MRDKCQQSSKCKKKGFYFNSSNLTEVDLAESHVNPRTPLTHQKTWRPQTPLRWWLHPRPRFQMIGGLHRKKEGGRGLANIRINPLSYPTTSTVPRGGAVEIQISPPPPSVGLAESHVNRPAPSTHQQTCTPQNPSGWWLHPRHHFQMNGPLL